MRPRHVWPGPVYLLAAASWAPIAAGAELPPPPTSPAPIVKREYYAGGQPKAVIQAPDQAGFNFRTGYGYDRLNRNTSITDPAAGVVDLGYGGRDLPTSITDPRRLVTSYDPDGFDQPRSLTSPDTGTATSIYDAAGNLLTRTDSRGVLATYTYDALNRPTSVTYSRAGSTSQTFSWGYDGTAPENTFGKGRLTSTTSPNNSSSYGYDEEGRLTLAVQRHTGNRELANVVQSVSYAYDSGGRLSRLTYPSGRVLSIGYSGGLPSTLTLLPSASATQGQALLSDIVFEPFGAARSWQWQLGGTALPHERVFDVYGRLVRYRLGAHVRDLTYDEADRIVRYTHYEVASGSPATALDQAFAYDSLGRLTSASVNGVTWTFSYDANGNRLTHSAGGTARNYTVSTTSNRLLALDNPARTFAHDEMGNVTSDNETLGTGVYDLSGRLASVTRGGVTTLYSLNALGQRVRKDTSSRAGERLIFAYDQAGHLLGEYDYTGKAVREYVWMGDTPVAVFTPGVQPADPPRVYAIHADHLDAPRVVVDASGGVRWRWLSDPFGVYVADENPAGLGAFALPLRFPGQYFDRETGLHYNWHRDYDGTVGRYAQSDPIGLDGGINTYAYVGGNPLSYVDPQGQAIQWVGAARAGAVFVAWYCAKNPKNCERAIRWAKRICEHRAAGKGATPSGSSGGPTAGKPHTKSQREEVQKSGNCHYCGHQSGDKTRADHVIPRSGDGNTSPGNTVGACQDCNDWWKNDMAPELWEEFISWVCGRWKPKTLALECTADE